MLSKTPSSSRKYKALFTVGTIICGEYLQQSTCIKRLESRLADTHFLD